MMNRVSKKKLWAALICLCLILCFGACNPAPSPHDFTYAAEPFSLTVTGEIRLPPDAAPPSIGQIREEALPFSALVTAAPMEAEEGLGKIWRVSVTYAAPDSLEGLSLEGIFRENPNGTETVTLRYPSPDGNLSLTLPLSSAEGLLHPITDLLPMGDVTAVTPIKDGVSSVTLRRRSEEITYFFSKEGSLPLRLEAQGRRLTSIRMS